MPPSPHFAAAAWSPVGIRTTLSNGGSGLLRRLSISVSSSSSSSPSTSISSSTIALWDKTRSFWDIKNSLSHEWGSERSERASKRVNAAEGTSKASSTEQANEWVVRANERTDERVGPYLRLYSCLFQTTVRRSGILLRGVVLRCDAGDAVGPRETSLYRHWSGLQYSWRFECSYRWETRQPWLRKSRGRRYWNWWKPWRKWGFRVIWKMPKVDFFFIQPAFKNQFNALNILTWYYVSKYLVQCCK